MGQNQEKMDGGEQVLAESRPSSESGGGGGDHTGDVMEGRCPHEREEEEEVEGGNNGQYSGDQDTVNEEPTTPCSQEKLWVSLSAAREVRPEGRWNEVEEGGGAGGRANRLAPQSAPRQEGRDAAFKSRSQSTREEKSVEEPLRRTPRSMMKEVIPQQEVQEEEEEESEAGVMHRVREDENLHSDTAEELEKEMVRRRRFCASPGQAYQRGADMVASGDSGPLTGTLDLLTEKKELPPNTSPHPSKNSLQKESQSELKDRVHSKAPSQTNLSLTEEETLKLLLHDCSPTRSKALRPCLQMEVAGGTTDGPLGSGLPVSGPGAPSEPSSILEKLLQRNKKQTNTANSEIQDVDQHRESASNNALKQLCDGAAPEVPPSRTDLCVTFNRVTAAKYGSSSEEESPGPSATHDRKITPARGDGQSSHNLPNSPDGGTPPQQPGISSVTGTDSTRTEDRGRRSTSKEHQQIVDQVEQDPPSTHHEEDLEPPTIRAGEESSDRVKMRDQSHHNRPRSRPVSQLIKETIQLHEKLQQQERARPAVDTRSEDQNQSVKVAQMKAAFDCAQKSPERNLERKPSVRKGKTVVLSHFLPVRYTATQGENE